MEKKRFGRVAILGATNAGKSTLLNALAREKVAITSRKVQTTREVVRGIISRGNVQIAFVDTPGVFEAKGAFDRKMVSAAWGAMDGADAVLFLVDALKGITPTFRRVVEKLKTITAPAALALNKVDAVRKPDLLELTARIAEETGALFEEIFMISAKEGDGLARLLDWAESKMPAGEWQFEEGERTDADVAERAAELTREQVYEYLHHELPYGITVRTDSARDRGGSVEVRQTIITENAAHKAIILGARGAKIKQIGERARGEMAALFGGRKVNLFLQVEVGEWK